MKKSIFLLLLIPLIGLSQDKTVLSSFKIAPKPDKIVEFEKALASHAQKYHSGDWKWRVYTVESGPDYGAYQITEGPSNWAAMDGRGEISKEHMLDWEKNVMPLTNGQAFPSSYSQFNADLSTAQLSAFTDKIIISHTFPKPGMIDKVTELEKQLKKVWDAGGETVAVYNIISSGEPQIVNVTRLKDGLKELDPSYRKPMKERFNTINGDGAWDKYLAAYADAVEKRWSEMLFFRADLSSK